MDSLAERYGLPSRRQRRVLKIVAWVVAAVAAAWLGWAAAFHASPAVRSSLSGFEIESDQLATAEVSVVRSADTVEASCLVRALASDHTVVGELTFPVADGPATQLLSLEVRTERQATAVELVGCVTEGQPRRR